MTARLAQPADAVEPAKLRSRGPRRRIFVCSRRDPHVALSRRSTVHKDRARFTTALLRDPDDRTQVIVYRIETASSTQRCVCCSTTPTLESHWASNKRHDAPAHNPARSVEHLARGIATLWRVLVHQRQLYGAQKYHSSPDYLRWPGSALFLAGSL